MSKNLILLIIILGLVSCYNESKPVVEPPDFLMSEEMVIDVLTDIQLAEGIITHSRRERKTTERDFKDSVYQVIFDHYEITAEQLNKNLDYYNSDVEQMEKMYEKVLENLSKHETEIRMADQKQDSAVIKSDSLSQIED